MTRRFCPAGCELHARSHGHDVARQSVGRDDPRALHFSQQFACNLGQAREKPLGEPGQARVIGIADDDVRFVYSKCLQHIVSLSMTRTGDAAGSDVIVVVIWFVKFRRQGSGPLFGSRPLPRARGRNAPSRGRYSAIGNAR